MTPNQTSLQPQQTRQLHQMVRFVRLVLDQKFVGMELNSQKDLHRD